MLYVIGKNIAFIFRKSIVVVKICDKMYNVERKPEIISVITQIYIIRKITVYFKIGGALFNTAHV